MRHHHVAEPVPARSTRVADLYASILLPDPGIGVTETAGVAKAGTRKDSLLRDSLTPGVEEQLRNARPVGSRQHGGIY